ncbi:MAG: 50S ribosomal protein L4 [Bacteroidales bacterium]|nr:50S ribosomal protein L4 [Bacteroidales bacterium]
MELEVYNFKGGKTGRMVNLNDGIFAIEPNDHAIYLDVKQHMANKRQGTHKSKERNEVEGSTRKLKRQKGTGTARFGGIKNPLFRGGGRVFGPKPRDYSFKLNKKLKKIARMSALSYKATDNNILVLEDFSFETHKTKNFVEMIAKLNLNEKKVLLVTKEPDAKLVLSSRNLQKVKVITAPMLCTYDILNAQSLVILEGSLQEIENVHLADTVTESKS